MPYTHAYDALKNPTSTVSDYIDAIEELGVQYGYIIGMVERGLREDAEIDLVRIRVLVDTLKAKIIDRHRLSEFAKKRKKRRTKNKVLQQV
jgi:hypothetical protein